MDLQIWQSFLKVSLATSLKARQQCMLLNTPTEPIDEYFFQILTGCCAPCKVELDSLVLKKRQEFFVNSRRRASLWKSMSNDQYPGPGWKPKGVLVAHLHEHQVN